MLGYLSAPGPSPFFACSRIGITERPHENQKLTIAEKAAAELKAKGK